MSLLRWDGRLHAAIQAKTKEASNVTLNVISEGLTLKKKHHTLPILRTTLNPGSWTEK
jgi:hypothetical protein